jgi:hypothetical protein
VVGHELGHNFGILHSHSLSCSGSIFTPTCDTSGSRSEYGDRFDTMGNSRAGHFNAYQKNYLGWMPAGSVATLSAGGADLNLSPFEGTTGLRALQIPTGVSSRTFWVEWRQPTGFDANFPLGGTNGAQIRIGPSRVGGTDLLDTNPATGTFDDAALPVGHWFGDTASGLEIETVSLSSGSLRVHAKFGFTIPTADFTFSPASPVGGHAVTFTDASTGFVDGWSWDFSDGGTSTLQNPVHSFSVSGPTNVYLTSSNPAGSSIEAVHTVTVSPNPPFRFYTVPPCRVADTRLPNGTYGGPALAAGSSRSFPMTGACGIPATARSVSLGDPAGRRRLPDALPRGNRPATHLDADLRLGADAGEQRHHGAGNRRRPDCLLGDRLGHGPRHPGRERLLPVARAAARRSTLPTQSFAL